MFLNHKSLSALAIAAGLFAGQAMADDHAPHWTYEGHGGPAEWGRLSHDFEACEVGKDQSPIDIKNAIPAKLSTIKVNYQPQALAVLNNGHTLQVNAKPGNTIEFEGETYDLLQYHFHIPSEHAVNGKKAPMEVHLVHKGQTSGKLTVLGVMMVPGAASSLVQSVWDAAPAEAGPVKDIADVSLNPASLLPAGRDYFRYEGSLTTPPCSEIVHWVTFKQPITVSQAQIDAFGKLFSNNARPLQPGNRRFILESEPK